jgi:acetyl-CoA synthetase
MEVREGSMGRPMPGWEVSILDEDERPVPPGERGEICLKARSNPHYPLGYWNRPDEDSEEVFGGEWFHSKDAACADDDGYFWYEGRADDVIISAVTGSARSRSSRRAWSTRRWPRPRRSPRRTNGAETWSRRSSCWPPDTSRRTGWPRRSRCSSGTAIPPTRIRGLIEFVPDLPRTLTGKIRRIELRQREQELASGSD